MGRRRDRNFKIRVLEAGSDWGYFTLGFLSCILKSHHTRVRRYLASLQKEGFFRILGFTAGRTPDDPLFGQWIRVTEKATTRYPSIDPAVLRVRLAQPGDGSFTGSVRLKSNAEVPLQHAARIATAAWLTDAIKMLAKRGFLVGSGHAWHRFFDHVESGRVKRFEALNGVPVQPGRSSDFVRPDITVHWSEIQYTGYIWVKIEERVRTEVEYWRLIDDSADFPRMVLYICWSSAAAIAAGRAFGDRPDIAVVRWLDTESLARVLKKWTR
jgi:hypothetical protein